MSSNQNNNVLESLNLLNPNSPFMKACTFIWHLLVLDVLFLLTCIPVFTIGAASTAMYTVIFDKENESSISKRYFIAFRDNFKSSTKARRCCFFKEFACSWGSISNRRKTTGIMDRGSRSVKAFSMERF